MKNVRNRLTLVLILVLAICFCGAQAVFAEDTGDTAKFGTLEEYSTFEPGKALKDSYYYDDNWFSRPATDGRNDAQALMSMQMVASVIEIDEDARCADLLKSMGFTNITSRSLGKNDDGFGYTYGIRNIGEDTLAAIVLHCYALDRDSKLSAWLQNFTINGDGVTSGEQYSYQKAVQKFDLDKLQQDMKAAAGERSGDLKFWVMGQSRGGAIANLLAVRLQDLTEAGNVYAYTFEAPATVDGDAIPADKDYSYIHNYYCDDDVVAMVPPWGMKRYGNTYELKGLLEEKGFKISDVNKQLKQLGSSGSVKEPEAMETFPPESLMAQLVWRVPTRADYSKVQHDSFQAVDGSGEVTLEYSYQDVFGSLMGVLFGDRKLVTEGVSDHLNELVGGVEPAIKAYLLEIGKAEGLPHEPNAYYWDAAQKLHELLKSLDPESEELPFTKQELYVLLKLAAPIVIDTNAVDEMDITIIDGPIEINQLIPVITPLLMIVANKDEYITSHMFDVLIARLKLLAPAPAMEDLSIEIPEPKAGETVAKTPGKVTSAINAMDHYWLDGSAKWDTDDIVLAKNKVYYLNVAFEVTGHSIPEDLKLTLNGESPVAEPSVSVKNGVQIVKAVWKFTLGNAAEHTISFKDYMHETTPDPITVGDGESLKYIQLPVLENDGEYRFDGWCDLSSDENSVPAEEIVVTKDMELYATWIRVIDDIELTFNTPHVGDTGWYIPATEDEDLDLNHFSLSDSEYEPVKGPIKAGEHTLIFHIAAEEGAEIAVALDEDYPEYSNFAGTLKINGEEVDASWDRGGYLYVNYTFEPLPARKSSAIGVTDLKLKAGDIIKLDTSGEAVAKWSSSASKVAKVSKGKVTALKKGKAVITAKLKDGSTLKFKVSVTSSPKLSEKSITVKKGKTKTVTILGKAPGVKNVYKNTKKAKVTSKATASKIKIKGLKKGKSTIKIKVNGVWLKLKVKVK